MELIIRIDGDRLFVRLIYNGDPNMNVDFPVKEVQPRESIYGMTYEQLKALGSGIHELSDEDSQEG